MKLIIAIVNKEDASGLMQTLSKNGYMSTRLATTGGFLRKGNVTLLIGTEEEKVDPCLELIRGCCSRQTQLITPTAGSTAEQVFAAAPIPVTVGGATVFVMDIDRFIKM